MSNFHLECAAAWDEKRCDKVLQAYAKPRLLIIDEWLATKPDTADLHAIKELVHRRRRKSSTIFCSQVLKEGWYQALGGEYTEAEAILDRITYDGYDINIEYTDPSNTVSMRKIYNRLKPIDKNKLWLQAAYENFGGRFPHLWTDGFQPPGLAVSASPEWRCFHTGKFIRLLDYLGKR